ncbi:hypothetical protein MTR67_001960 [Solanum verrucosum]|uniref:RNase H type-1 domain-containing protein n=1 Tax=Solanum verrucosum TaxID=315347 RepID=A0AAF0TCV7_SOLVR|nr:hypothetical protein MTR67_001960 [Solanum verrucosum]
MVQILQGNWEVPWSVTMEVNSIRALMCNIPVRVIHIFKEGNTLADFFTNLVFDFAGDFQFNYFGEIPTTERMILNLDKAGTPHIRRSNQDS